MTDHDLYDRLRNLAFSVEHLHAHYHLAGDRHAARTLKNMAEDLWEFADEIKTITKEHTRVARQR